MSKLTDFLQQERQALIGYVRRRIDDASGLEAEDIVQDVALHLFDQADPSIPIQNLAAYFYTALRNRIIDFYRKKKETVALVPSHAPAPSLEMEIDKNQMIDEVFEAMEELSAGEKAVVLATEMEGRTFKELASEWNIPLGTLLARKSRALKKIRMKLTGQTNPGKGVPS